MANVQENLKDNNDALERKAYSLSGAEKDKLMAIKNDASVIENAKKMEVTVALKDGTGMKVKAIDLIKAIANAIPLSTASGNAKEINVYYKNALSRNDILINGKKVDNAQLGWGSEVMAALQVAAGGNLTPDGKFGDSTAKAFSELLTVVETKAASTNAKVDKTKTKTIDFFKTNIAEGFKELNLNATVTDPEVRKYVKAYISPTGAFTNTDYLKATSYSNLAVTVLGSKFTRNKKVADQKILGSTFIERDGTFDDTKFALQFEKAIKAMIKEDHDTWTGSEKAEEVKNINALATKINTYVALTDMDLAKVNKGLFRNDLLKNQIAGAEKELNDMKVNYAGKELADLKAKMPGYKQKFADKIAEVNRAIDKDTFNANRLAKKTDGLSDATDLGSLVAMKSSLKDLKALKVKVAGDVTNYTSKNAIDKSSLLANIEAKVQSTEKRLKYLELKQKDETTISGFEKFINDGEDLTPAEEIVRHNKIGAKTEEYKKYRKEFDTRKANYALVSYTDQEKFEKRLKTLDKTFLA